MRIIFLESTFGNYQGDIVRASLGDDGTAYYYDNFRRYCFLKAKERGKIWKQLGENEMTAVEKLNEALAAFRNERPEGRSDQGRVYSIIITELEKISAYAKEYGGIEE
jgi:hypothetical protein